MQVWLRAKGEHTGRKGKVKELEGSERENEWKLGVWGMEQTKV